MKKHALGIILSILFSNLYSQPETIWQLWSDGSLIRFVYAWGDEFSGETLDESKWMNCYPWGRNYAGTCYQEYMTDGDNIVLEDGILKLIAKREDVYARGVPYETDDFPLSDGLPNLRWWHYTSGMIFSKREFKNGLFEIRCKLPAGKGFWPAFWLFSGNPHEEIDIFEYKGENPNRIQLNVHCPHQECGGVGEWLNSSTDFSSQFTTIMMQWEQNAVLWHFPMQTFILLGALNDQKPIIANLGIANESPCAFSPGPDDSTPFPAAFEIDYIRVWKRYDCENTIVISNYTQTRAPTSLTGQDTSITNMSLSSEQSLSMASDRIRIEPDSSISENFEAKIVDCPEIEHASPYGTVDISSGQLAKKQKAAKRLSNDQASEVKRVPVLNAKIFPNPALGKISFEFENITAEYVIKIELINAAGQVLFIKENINDNRLDIDISHLPKGIYFLRGTSGKESITEKIILQ